MSEQKPGLSNNAVIALIVIGWIACANFLQAIGYGPNVKITEKCLDVLMKFCIKRSVLRYPRFPVHASTL